MPAQQTASQGNAFLEALKRAPDVLGRIAQVPFRAAALPFQLIDEVRNSPRTVQARAAADLRRQLNQQVTGQEVPFSQGRQLANAFSFGLIPGNPSSRLDPNQLNPEQRGRFNELTPLQQRLLQARSASDFASLVGEDALFAEPQGPEPISKFGKEERDVAQGFGSREALNAARGVGQPFLTAAGPEALLKLFTPESIQQNIDPETGQLATLDGLEFRSDITDTAKLGDLLKQGYTPDSVERFNRTKRVSDLVLDKAAVEAEAEDRTKGAPNRRAIRGQYNQQVKPYLDAATTFRTFLGNFGQEKGKIPADILTEMQAAGVNLERQAPGPLRDMAMVFGFMKAQDEDSAVRESEQAMAKAAARYGINPDYIRKLWRGDILTVDQRNEMIQVMRDTFKRKLEGYSVLRAKYLDIAAAEDIADEDIQIPNYLEDLQAFIEGGFERYRQVASEGAAGPPLTRQAAMEISQQFEASAGRAPTAEELKAMAAQSGYRVQD